MCTMRPGVIGTGLGGPALALLTGVPSGLASTGRKTLLVLALAGSHGKNAHLLVHFVTIFLSAPLLRRKLSQ